MKNKAITTMAFICCLSLCLFAQDKKDSKNIVFEPAVAGPVVTLTDGGVSVSVNSFGLAGHGIGIGTGFNIDEPATSVLYQHTDFLSAGGPVAGIAPPPLGQCTILNAITADSASHATSEVQCGDCIVDFDQTVDDVSKTWTAFVTVSGCKLACYYSYNDYDVHGFPNNGSSWHPGEGGFLGQYVVRNNLDRPEVQYLFTDQSGADHWQQGEYPSILNLISGFQSCTDLADTPLLFANGDWTGALEFMSGIVDQTLSYSLGRDDTVPFP